MLTLKNKDDTYNIPEEEIINIAMRDKLKWIHVETDENNINLFYDIDKEYETDKLKCKKWIDNIKPELEKNKEEIETSKQILNALDTLKQVCEHYCDDCEQCPFRTEQIELIEEMGSICFFEAGFTPGLWGILEPEHPEDTLLYIYE